MTLKKIIMTQKVSLSLISVAVFVILKIILMKVFKKSAGSWNHKLIWIIKNMYTAGARFILNKMNN